MFSKADQPQPSHTPRMAQLAAALTVPSLQKSVSSQYRVQHSPLVLVNDSFWLHCQCFRSLTTTPQLSSYASAHVVPWCCPMVHVFHAVPKSIQKKYLFLPVHQKKVEGLILPLHKDMYSLMASFINTSCIPPKGAVCSKTAKYISILQP